MPHDADELQQMAEQAGRPWYRVENAAKAGEKTRAKVHIFDAIGGWFGVRAKDLVQEIADLDVDEIEVRLNSPGGSVWDGTAIMNALRSHRARVEVFVDGIAASIASVIAMGGDEIIMSRGSQMMIHRGSTITWGNASDLRKDAAVLDKIDSNIAGIYAARAGGDAADWLALMEAETWYNADEAVEAKLADRTDEPATEDEDEADVSANFDLSLFHYAGRDKAPAPLRRDDVAHARATYGAEGFSALLRMASASAHMPPVSSESGNTTRKESAMPDLKDGIRDRLGITDAEMTDEALLAALDGRLAQNSTNPPVGTTIVDDGVLAQMRADAAAGREARDQQITERRDKIIADAMADGKMTAKSAKAFRAQLDENETGTVAIINTLASNSVPVVELGTSSDPAEAAQYATYYSTPKEA